MHTDVAENKSLKDLFNNPNNPQFCLVRSVGLGIQMRY